MTRRRLLQAAAASSLVLRATAPARAAVPDPILTFPSPADGAASRWLGPDVWGNRLADWVARDGSLVCVAAADKRRLCTASVVTRRLTGGAASLSVGISANATGGGFAGFLIGTGTDRDHRRTALVATSSGTGGGLLAVIGDDGVVRFRDHASEVDPFGYAPMSAVHNGPKRPLAAGERVVLRLKVLPHQQPGKVSLRLSAVDSSGAELSRATLTGVQSDLVAGGLAVVSAAEKAGGPRYSFTRLSIQGDGVEVDVDRGLGPVLGTLFSLSGDVLKMTAQLCAITPAPGDEVMLETLQTNGSWVVRDVAPIGAGFTAGLRVESWDATVATPYRVSLTSGGDAWSGTIPAEPGPGRPVRIATVTCSMASFRGIDRASPVDQGLGGTKPPLLYTDANVWFPFERCFEAVAAQKPDLLVAMGDQYYEQSPTVEDPSTSPNLDFLYKYFLWMWAVRDLAKDRPTLVLVDDHDVFQGNLWGEGGVAAPGGDYQQGGYSESAAWVNLVQRVQCGHNPDPVDPAPVAQGINVYFTRFDYAGITFVILEDRKFRTAPDGVIGDHQAPFELLGERQEAMLNALAAEKQGSGLPVVVLTQTVYAAVETTVDNKIKPTYGVNSFSKPSRDRALVPIKAAGGVMLSGDTHLSTLVRHLGLSSGRGPVQFTAPAVAAAFQRWFTPAAPLAQPGAQPYTGRVVDKSGGTYIVHAVANPAIDQASVLNTTSGHVVGDRSLKTEGYGMLKVDHARRTYRFESWPGDVDPTAEGAAPYPGWPYVLAFDDA